MRAKHLSDSGFAFLLMIACLLLAAATIILYSDNLEYKKLNKELMMQNDSIRLLNIELSSEINTSRIDMDKSFTTKRDNEL